MSQPKIKRVVTHGITFVNIHEVDQKRLEHYIVYELNLKNYESIPDIYEFIFKNLVKPENYIVQAYNSELIIQKLGK